MAWRTDDLGVHEGRYRKLGEEAAEGWSAEADVRDLLSFVREVLPREGVPRHGRILELGCSDLRLVARRDEDGPAPETGRRS